MIVTRPNMTKFHLSTANPLQTLQDVLHSMLASSTGQICMPYHVLLSDDFNCVALNKTSQIWISSYKPAFSGRAFCEAMCDRVAL